MSKIPEIDSFEELARFCDTRELTDYEGELQESKSPLSRCRTEAALGLHEQGTDPASGHIRLLATGHRRTPLIRARTLLLTEAGSQGILLRSDVDDLRTRPHLPNETRQRRR